MTLYSYTTEPATTVLVDNVDQVVASAENTAWKVTKKLAFKLEQQAISEIKSKV